MEENLERGGEWRAVLSVNRKTGPKTDNTDDGEGREITPQEMVLKTMKEYNKQNNENREVA